MSDELEELHELRRTEQVIAALQQMLSCRRRGVCLLREWMRRYGNAGGGCSCFNRFEEHMYVTDVDDE